MPSPAHARFLLPLDLPPRARARLLLHYNHLRTDRRRAQRFALAGLAGAGLPRPRLGRSLLVAERGRGPGLLEVVADALEMPADHLALSVGVRPGTGPLTPTVTVVDRSGEPQVFVKVAAQPGTRSELDAELEALTVMRQPSGNGLLVPGPMFRVEWGDALVVGIEPLPLDVRRVGPEELDDVQPFLDRFVASRPVEHLTLHVSPWTARLRRLVAGLPAPWADPLAAGLDDAVSRHGGALPHGLRHGDWSSWNMARSARVGGLAVWDWEFSEPMAPLGLDRCNWGFAYDTSVRHVSMTDASRRLRETSTDVADPPLVELYLLDMAVRRAVQASDGNEAAASYADELVALLD